MGTRAEMLDAIFTLCLVLLFLIVYALFLLFLQKALTLAGAKNRRMSPGLVWLNFIPLFSFGWMFYTAYEVSRAIVNKLTSINRENIGDGGWGLGLAAATLNIMAGLLQLFAIIGIPGAGVMWWILGIPTLIVMIVYWVKIARYNDVMSSQ